MKCPICDNQIPDNDLRCANCNSPLTVWKNLDAYADQSYRAGLEFLARGNAESALEMLCRCVTFAPDDARYLECYGKLLARMGRLVEAASTLEKANQISASEETQQAIEKVREMLAVPESPDTAPSPTRLPLAVPPLWFGGQDENEPENGQHDNDEPAGAHWWAQCLEIEKNWLVFSPFAEILDWHFGDGQPAPAEPLAYLQGVRAYVARNDAEAKKCFQQSISESSHLGNADIYLVLLSTPEELDDTLSTLADKGRSPSQIACVLSTAASIETDDHRETLPDLLRRALLGSGPDQIELARRLINTCRTADQTQQALQVLHTCIEQEPSLELMMLVGDVHGRLGNHDQAEALFTAASSQYPDAWQPILQLANLFMQTDQGRSLELLNAALERCAPDGDGRTPLTRMRLSVLLNLQDWQAALLDARALAESCPAASEYATIIADCESRLKDDSTMAAEGSATAVDPTDGIS